MEFNQYKIVQIEKSFITGSIFKKSVKKYLVLNLSNFDQDYIVYRAISTEMSTKKILFANK